MNVNELQNAIDFYNQGNSMASTAKAFGSTSYTLKKLFSERGVHIRNQREQVIIDNKKRSKKVNNDYFDTLNQENVYYLGFFAADSTIRKTRNEIKIGLSSVDKSFLEELKEKMGIEKDVHVYTTNNGFECVELTFSSEKIKKTLAQYDIVPNKTITGIHLTNIPDEFKLAFIKGFFDGDGSFSYNKNTKQAKVSFTSYTREILEEIQKFIKEGYIYSDSRRDQLFSLELSTLPSLRLMESFYSLDTPCLERKKQKYFECLKLRNKSHETEAPSEEG